MLKSEKRFSLPFLFLWNPRQDLNLQPLEPKSIVLSVELRGHGCLGWIRTNATRSQSPMPYHLATR